MYTFFVPQAHTQTREYKYDELNMYSNTTTQTPTRRRENVRIAFVCVHARGYTTLVGLGSPVLALLVVSYAVAGCEAHTKEHRASRMHAPVTLPTATALLQRHHQLLQPCGNPLRRQRLAASLARLAMATVAMEADSCCRVDCYRQPVEHCGRWFRDAIT